MATGEAGNNYPGYPKEYPLKKPPGVLCAVLMTPLATQVATRFKAGQIQRVGVMTESMFKTCHLHRGRLGHIEHESSWHRKEV